MIPHLVLCPEELHTICRAYDEAVRQVSAPKAPSASTWASQDVIARRILDVWLQGERDEFMLVWAGMGRSRGPNSLQSTAELACLPIG
jgi:hypothetical protein